MTSEGGGKIKKNRTSAPPKPYERRKSWVGTVKNWLAPSWLSDLVHSVKKKKPGELGEIPDEQTESQDAYMSPAQQSSEASSSRDRDCMIRRPAVPQVPQTQGNGDPRSFFLHTQSTETDQMPSFTSSQLPLSQYGGTPCTESSAGPSNQQDNSMYGLQGYRRPGLSDHTQREDSFMPTPDNQERDDIAFGQQSYRRPGLSGQSPPQDSFTQSAFGQPADNQYGQQKYQKSGLGGQKPALFRHPASSHLPVQERQTWLFGQAVDRVFSQMDDNQSDKSDGSKSTSGCSSLVPHPDQPEYQREILQLNEHGLENLKDQLLGPVKPHIQTTDKTKTSEVRTWSQRYNSVRVRTPNPATKSKPTFNASLFGSPLVNNSLLLGDSFHESSFYEGKTTYGGASAQRRKLNTTAPYETSLPLRRQMKAKPLNQSFSAVTSATARKILETLEKMPTPLSDARKIPDMDTSVADSYLSFTPSSYRHTPRPNWGSLSRRQSLEASSKGPPRTKLNTPSVASISKNRQVISSASAMTSSTTSSVSQQQTSQATTSTHSVTFSKSIKEDVISSAPPQASGVGGKMKREKSYHHGPGKIADDDDVIEIPNLKTDFTLPVGQMPKFAFESPVTTSTAPSPMESLTRPSLKFTFSTPIQRSATVPASLDMLAKERPDFKFSSPISLEPAGSKPLESPFSKMDTGATTAAFSTAFSPGTAPKPRSQKSTPKVEVQSEPSGMKPAAVLKTGSVMDFLGKSGASEKAANGAISPATELKQGSVMDVLGKGTKPSISGNLFGKMQTTTGSWTCDTCLISNKQEDVKCVACQASKPTPKTDSQSSSSSSQKNSDNLFGKFAPASGTWSCDSCLVPNKADAVTCIACQSAKPSSKSTGSGGQSDSLMSKFAPAVGSWTCGSCLVSNKSEDVKCAACLSAKPSVAGSAPLKSDGFNMSKFQPASGSWSCDVCLVKNTADVTKCAACQSSKPGAVSKQKSSPLKVKKPTGNWECDTCLVPNKADVVKCIACESPRPGTQPSATAAAAGGLKIDSSAFSSKSSFIFDNSSKTTTSGTGFKFGGSSGTSDTPVTTVFNSQNDATKGDSSSEKKSASGFVFNSDSKVESDKNSTGGLVFGAPIDTEPNDNSDKRSSGELVFGPPQSTAGSITAVFGQKVDNGIKESVPGGFTFGKPGDSKDAKATFSIGSSDITKVGLDKPVVNKSEAVKPDFSFGQNLNTEEKNKPLGSQVGLGASSGFNFVTQPLQNKETSAGIGGFTFGKTSSETDSNKPVLGGFSFSKPEEKTTATKPFSFGSGAPTFNLQPKSDSTDSGTTSVAKRGRDDESDASAAKKPAFSGFGGVGSSNTGPFNFEKAASTGTTPAFSLTGSATGGGTGTTASGGMFVFGQQSTATSNTSTTSAFTSPFGANTMTSSKLAASAAPPFSMSTSASAPVFGFAAQNNVTSTKPEFSAAPPAAGSTAPNFAFGMAGKTTTAGAAAFGGTPPFSFTAPSQTVTATSSAAAPFGTATAAVTPLAFGGSTTTFGSTGFNFNANTSFNLASGGGTGGSAPSGIFQFGAKAAEGTTAPAAPQPQQPAATTGFNFGPAVSAPSAGQGFNFSATPSNFNFAAAPTPTFAFSATSTPGEPHAAQGRRIKKAVRKIRR